jgi:23S rRNA pseudouridine1911/1915/1917 synthase
VAQDEEDDDELSLTVSEEHAGLRLDVYLRTMLPDRSRALIQKHIDEGAVMINGAPPKRSASTQVAPGDQIVYVPPPPPIIELVPEEIPLSILFEDEFLVVVDKQKNLVVHPAAGHASGTLANALLHHFGRGMIRNEIRPGIVHRLDRDTTGAIVVAKTQRIHDALGKLFAERAVTKEYLAVVSGAPKEKSKTIATLYGRHPRDRKKFSSKVGSGKRAVTRYRVIEALENASLLEVSLETGRTHQIRVHLADAGHALVGDAVYGKKSPLIDRPALHARRLAFVHPATHSKIDIEAPVPDDLRQLLEKLR